MTMSNKNLLFSKPHDTKLQNVGDFLVRPSTSEPSYFTIDAMNDKKVIVKTRVTLDQLNASIRNGYYGLDDNKRPLLKQVEPNQDQASTTKRLIFSKKTGEIIEEPIVGNYLRIVDNFNAVFSSMRNHESPSIFIYRTPSQTMENITFTIENKNQIPLDGNHKAICQFYTAYYLQEDNKVVHIKFQTYTNNPNEINKILYDNLMQREIKPKSEVRIELLHKELPKTKVGLAYLHRDKTLHAEEYYLINSDHKIFAIQTPKDDAIQGDFDKFINAPAGATSGAIYRILNNPKFPSFEEKWIFVAGHGNGDKPLSGEYDRIRFNNETDDSLLKSTIECSPYELACLIRESKPGSHVKILLYVCYGAVDIGNNESFAKQLARHLADFGISSTIVASKKSVERFNGIYQNDEKENECLRYRVNGDPNEDIVVIMGEPGEPTMIREIHHQYPDGFYITSQRIGSPDEEKKTRVDYD